MPPPDGFVMHALCDDGGRWRPKKKPGSIEPGFKVLAT
jgi:hypothetical protein